VAVSAARGTPGGSSPALWDWLARRGWLVWGLIVLVVSVVPVGWVFGLAPEETWSLGGSIGHFFEFGLFAALVAIAWGRRGRVRDGRPAGAGDVAGVSPRRGLVAGALAAVAYGAAIEVAQVPIPYRNGDWRDLAVDGVGTAAGLGILVVARRRSRRPRRPVPPRRPRP
jgi:VanZ like family